MAKQEAFEEKTKLKNQFRSLDEDEVDFLDSVLESTRAQEAAVKKDTADQLEVFRKQREEAEKALLGPTSSDVTPAEEEEWAIPARKRRRDKKDLLLPGKKRKASLEGGKDTAGSPDANTNQSSQKDGKGAASAVPKPLPKQPESANVTSNATKPSATQGRSDTTTKAQSQTNQPKKEAPAPAPAPAPAGLGLVGYGSDSDSE